MFGVRLGDDGFLRSLGVKSPYYQGGGLGGAGPSVLAFSEIGRTTLASPNSTITVSGLPNKKWLIVLIYSPGANADTADGQITFNSDSGTNYASRQSLNGAGDTTAASAALIRLTSLGATPMLNVLFIENTTANEKLLQAWQVNQETAGSATATQRTENAGKWANTASAITSISLNKGADTYNTGSEMVVLGADPGDTNVTPFFTEIGRNTFASGLASQTAVLTVSRKYNLIIGNGVMDSASGAHLRLGNGSIDTTNNYNSRISTNGAADAVTGAVAGAVIENVGVTTPWVNFGFIINVAANEKLMIIHEQLQGVAGSGNSPQRCEMVGKWSDTTNQFDRFALVALGGTILTGSEWVIYGSD